MEQIRPILLNTRTILQSFSVTLIALASIVVITFSALAAFGVVPWLELPILIDGTLVEDAGFYVQLGVMTLLLSLCFFVPTNRRIMQLESAHHGFSLRMEDIQRAYAAVHAADRKGVFQASSEFDAVKERMLHLRNHPDLGSLEPDILEVAAQMSRISQDLAETYCDERIDRARDFLRQRQAEIETFQDRLEHAKALHADIRQWANRVEMDEAVAQSQLNRLLEGLAELLPEIDIGPSPQASKNHRQNGVIRLSSLAAE
ncbi:DNA repair protein [uncultured Roseobacter sp.]|uniref:DNA repair protein n=1 Tax=uncultured Roseobacter sp. TaxID=114847 RepID=UPI00262CD2FE|nr:DNA repair protein [uncultured Roseobacter sp.]